MVSPNEVASVHHSPWLCTTYEGRDPQYLETVLPLVDLIELTPDAIANMGARGPELDAETCDHLQNLSGRSQFVAHGVGLSLGSYDGYSPTYLPLVEALNTMVPLLWHSEHLAYTLVNGENLGTMLALPKTRETLDLVCRRIEEILQRIPLPFLIENVVHVLPDYPGDFSDAAFLNTLVARTGCGLLLDVYNLECDRQNHEFDIEQFLDELDLAHVQELHVACGVELDGFLVDVHSRGLRDSTLRLARSIVERAPNIRAVTFELLHQAIPLLGHENILLQLKRVREEVCN